MKKVMVCSALVVASTLTMHAQQSRGGGQPSRYVGLSRPIEGQAVKGAPYSAEIVNESIQTLTDGNRIVKRTTGRIYRDTAGRVRREEDRASGGPSVSITDPVAGTSFNLDPQRRKARQTPLLVLHEFKDRLNELQLFTSGAFTYSNFERGYFGLVGRAGAASDTTEEEKLAERTIEGVTVTGIRRTTTIAAGAIGNEQPIKIVSEEWTSSQLQVLVMTDLNDPRTGRSTYRLLKISRAEPDAALFKVPGDYDVERLPGGRGGGQ